jgi:hypothetical protein
MSFGRHRTQPGINGSATLQKKGVLKILSDEHSDESIIILPEEKEEKKVVTFTVTKKKKRSHQAQKEKPGERVITNTVEKEEIKKVQKIYIDNTNLIGKNTICKDFRAICKKNDFKMNEILNTILHEWNTKNYNL